MLGGFPLSALKRFVDGGRPRGRPGSRHREGAGGGRRGRRAGNGRGARGAAGEVPDGGRTGLERVEALVHCPVGGLPAGVGAGGRGRQEGRDVGRAHRVHVVPVEHTSGDGDPRGAEAVTRGDPVSGLQDESLIEGVHLVLVPNSAEGLDGGLEPTVAAHAGRHGAATFGGAVGDGDVIAVPDGLRGGRGGAAGAGRRGGGGVGVVGFGGSGVGGRGAAEQRHSAEDREGQGGYAAGDPFPHDYTSWVNSGFGTTRGSAEYPLKSQVAAGANLLRLNSLFIPMGV